MSSWRNSVFRQVDINGPLMPPFHFEQQTQTLLKVQLCAISVDLWDYKGDGLWRCGLLWGPYPAFRGVSWARLQGLESVRGPHWIQLLLPLNCTWVGTTSLNILNWWIFRKFELRIFLGAAEFSRRVISACAWGCEQVSCLSQAQFPDLKNLQVLHRQAGES